MSGRKSATSASSRALRYSPGADVSYKFATRTFSREGRRPATSPARIKHSGLRKGNNPSPEDVIAWAQSPSPSFIQESYGGSLLMLRQGLKRVRPGKFLELQKLINQPSPVPLSSPRSAVSTPRLVKSMVARAKTAESSQITLKNSKATQYDYLSSQVSKAASSTTRSQITGPQHSDSLETREPRSSLSYSKIDDFPQRCVRCSEFPDIQIEGHSLSRILTNPNVLMAKEYCEVLGAGSCPDCIRLKSQRQHEDHCSKNTPAIPNDVYKIALVHEKSPHLTKRQVQRKFFDGEISDKILTFPYWNQDGSLPISNHEYQNEHELETVKENHRFLPDINNDKLRNKIPTKTSRSQNNSTFETIYEASENDTESEAEDRPVTTSSAVDETSKTKEIIYQKHIAEELMKIQVVPASEISSPSEISSRSNGIDIAERKSRSNGSQTYQQKNNKVEASNQTEMIPLPTTAARKRLKRRYFTVNVVPSDNFFFDIADLAERLRNSGKITHKEPHKQVFQLIDVHQFTPNPVAAANPSNDKMETDSIASDDSTKPVKDFNMSYEPPVFYNYKGGYLGLNSATSRTSSSVRSIG